MIIQINVKFKKLLSMDEPEKLIRHTYIYIYIYNNITATTLTLLVP